MSPYEVAEKVDQSLAIITGGEPTLQDLSELLELLPPTDMETNGTNPIDPSDYRLVVVSPKKGSDVNLDYWKEFDNVHFKFVIGPAPWCWSMPPKDLPASNVWLMPFGIDQRLEWAQKTWDLALLLGYNYSDRLHVRMGRQ